MQATIILNHENVNVSDIGQGEAQHKKYKSLRHEIDQLSRLWLYPWAVYEQ